MWADRVVALGQHLATFEAEGIRGRSRTQLFWDIADPKGATSATSRIPEG
jgi:hypothetical protein